MSKGTSVSAGKSRWNHTAPPGTYGASGAIGPSRSTMPPSRSSSSMRAAGTLGRRCTRWSRIVAHSPSSGNRSRAGSKPYRFGSGGCCLLLIGNEISRRSWSEAAQPVGGDADRHRILLEELLARHRDALQALRVLLDVGLDFLRPRRAVVDAGRSREHHHLTAALGAVELERDPRVARDIAQLRPVRLAEEQDFARAPQEPHRVRLWRAAGADRRQPDDLFAVQAPGDLGAEFCCGVDELRGSGCGHRALLARSGDL